MRNGTITPQFSFLIKTALKTLSWSLFLLTNVVFAASITASKSSIFLGESVQVSVGIPGGSGYCDVSSTPTGLTGRLSLGQNATFKPSTATTYSLNATCTVYGATGPKIEMATTSLQVSQPGSNEMGTYPEQDGTRPSIPGNLKYEASVNARGEATIRVPIRVLPGVSGMQPDIDLVYNSNRIRRLGEDYIPAHGDVDSNWEGNEDYVGFGWRIAGLSKIHTCTTGFSEGMGSGMERYSVGRLCLDGEPLQLVDNSNGAVYYLENNQMIRIERIGPDLGGEITGFRVTLPNGTVREYGTSPVGASRMKVQSQALYPTHSWALYKSTDVFGNSIEYENYSEYRHNMFYPKYIYYGPNKDTRVYFKFAAREASEDITPQEWEATGVGKVSLTEIILSTKNASGQYQDVKNYYLTHRKPAGFPVSVRNYRQLETVQECGYASNGNQQCFRPLIIEWALTDTNSQTMPRYVKRITDSHGFITEFDMLSLTQGSNTGKFTERPFGEASLPSNTRVAAPTNHSDYRQLHVVTAKHEMLAPGSAKLTTNYAYQGNGVEGMLNEGFLGFFAQRIQNAATGVTTYKQVRMDKPFVGRIAGERTYTGIFGQSGSLALGREDLHYANHVVQHPGAAVAANHRDTVKIYNRKINYPYLSTKTSYVYERGQLVSATRMDNVMQFSTSGFLEYSTRTTRASASISTAMASSQSWGHGTPAVLGASLRQKTEIRDYLQRINTTGTWLTDFLTREQVEYRNGQGQLTARHEQSQTPYQSGALQTNLVGSETRFVGDADLQRTVSYIYTTSGLPQSITTSGAHIAQRTTGVSAYEFGRFPSDAYNALGHRTITRYDRVTGLPLNTTDANNRVEQRGYNGLGQLTQLTTADGVTLTTSQAFCTEVSCPAGAAYRISATSPVSPTTHSYYDSLDRVIETRTQAFGGVKWITQTTLYDLVGRKERISNPYFSDDPVYYTRFEYDNSTGRVLKEFQPAGGELHLGYNYNSSRGGLALTATRKIKNAQGASLTDQVKVTWHNALGEVVERADAYGTAQQVSTVFTYDGAGRNNTILVNNSKLIRLAYDDAGNRTRLEDPDVGVVTSRYNALGEAREEQDNSGQITSYTFDLLGRPSTQTTIDGVQSWYYDKPGAIGLPDYTEFRDANTAYYHKQQHYYRSDTKLERTRTEIRVPGYNRSYDHSLTYDSYGRISSATSPSGYRTINNYQSGTGYLESVVDGNGVQLSKTLTMDAWGQATQETFGSGLSSSRNYNPVTGRLTSILTRNSSNATIQSSNFQWRSNGLLEQRTNNRLNASESFNYDALDRLTDAETYINATRQRHLNTGYDLTGNITHKKTPQGEGSNLSDYRHDRNTGGGPGAVSQVTLDGVVTTLYYNANGGINRYDAATGHDKWINWNTRGKPTRISKGTTENQYQARDTFAYGIDGARYYRKAEWYDSQNIYNLEHTFYVGNYEDVVNQSSFDYSRMEKTNLGGLISIRGTRLNGTVENTTEFTLTDHLGSIETVIDSSGNALHLAYDPFGERRDNNWRGIVTTLELEAIEPRLRKSTRRGYTGHEHLDRTGLIHMNGRVYDPTLGRFISPDPFVQAPYFSQSYNRYSYVWNNPVVRYDPTGYLSQSYTSSGGSPSLSSFGGSSLEEDEAKKSKKDWDDGGCGVNCYIIRYDKPNQDSHANNGKNDTQGEVAGSDNSSKAGERTEKVDVDKYKSIAYTPGNGMNYGALPVEQQKALAILGVEASTFAIPGLGWARFGNWLKGFFGAKRGAQGGIEVAKEISISRTKYGEAAEHIADAQNAGHPNILTIARDGASANRSASIGAIPKVSGKQLDEYPPAMFKEGGAGASVRPISPRDNMAAGACIGNACRGLADGEKILIKVID